MDWRGLIFFMMLAIPIVALLTHLVAYVVRCFMASPVEPYSRYEEFRQDLIGGKPIDEILERCNGAVPGGPAGAGKKEEVILKANRTQQHYLVVDVVTTKQEPPKKTLDIKAEQLRQQGAEQLRQQVADQYFNRINAMMIQEFSKGLKKIVDLQKLKE
jgi:hypothetical protein